MSRPLTAYTLCLTALMLGACEVGYKAQDDAMYYTDRSIAQYKKGEKFIHSRFDKNYKHPPVSDLPLHLSNFDTFTCDGARQLVANFDRSEMTVSLKFDGKNKYLTRTDTYMPFSDKIYDLYIMDDGTLLLQRDKSTTFQHCRPFIADTRKSQPFTGGGRGAGAPVDMTYQYTPTISPVDYNRGDRGFERSMTK